MGVTLQTLIIPVAVVATFAGVYALAPGAGSSQAPAAAAQDAALATSATANSDPLAPAARGLAECYEPDIERKTCQSMASYKALGGGRYDSTSVMLVSSQGPVTFEINAPVMIKAGQACATIERKYFAAGHVRVAGRLVSRSEGAAIWAAVEQSIEPMVNREVCTAYASSATGTTARNIVDGRWQVDKEQQVVWIRPDDGYRVAP